MLVLAESRQARHNKESYDDIKVRVSKGYRAVVRGYAEKHGKSLNGYIIGLIEADMKPSMGADFSLTSKSTEE